MPLVAFNYPGDTQTAEWALLDRAELVNGIDGNRELVKITRIEIVHHEAPPQVSEVDDDLGRLAEPSAVIAERHERRQAGRANVGREFDAGLRADRRRHRVRLNRQPARMAGLDGDAISARWDGGRLVAWCPAAAVLAHRQARPLGRLRVAR